LVEHHVREWAGGVDAAKQVHAERVERFGFG
jgi:hypothetical protein